MSATKPEQSIPEMDEHEIIKNILGYDYGKKKRIKRNVRFGEKRFPLDVFSLSQTIDVIGSYPRKIVYIKTQPDLGTYLVSTYFNKSRNNKDYSFFREMFTEKGYTNFRDTRIRVSEQRYVQILNTTDLSELLESIGHHARILMFFDLNSPGWYYLTHCVREETSKPRILVS